MARHEDPSCGMPVEEERAAGRSGYGGRDYYFCGAGRRERFDQDPGGYADRGGGEGAGRQNVR